MAIEAPFSKFRKTNLKVYIAFCLGFAVIFAYDGYLSKYRWSLRRSFYEKHVKEGEPDDKMVFNQITPLILVAGAAGFAEWLRAVKNKKLLADENELVVCDKKRIAYDSIEKIDKTNFDSKGFFIITYKDQTGTEVNYKLSNKRYDNLAALLDELVAKIS